MRQEYWRDLADRASRNRSQDTLVMWYPEEGKRRRRGEQGRGGVGVERRVAEGKRGEKRKGGREREGASVGGRK